MRRILRFYTAIYREGLDEGDGEISVRYTITPGYPERGPTYSCGGTPAEPPKIEIESATFNGVEVDLTDDEVTRIMEQHEWDSGIDPDDERDRLINLLINGEF